jgi:N-acetylglutamate synthase-like GNAT family acetyltransferase
MTSAPHPHPPIRIRSATTADIPAVAAVVNAAFAIETFVEGERVDGGELVERMRTGELVVAEGDGGIAGCVHIEMRGEHGFFSMLAVAPQRQGAGLGRTLVAFAEDRCRERGCRDMTITVLSLRAELLPFYRKLGYAETGTEPFQPSQPLKQGTVCHSIIMRKPL